MVENSRKRATELALKKKLDQKQRAQRNSSQESES